MNWSDEGFLISKTRYNENSLIAELFTKDNKELVSSFRQIQRDCSVRK